MFSRTMESKASCEIAIAISLLCLWAWVPVPPSAEWNGTNALLGFFPFVSESLMAILNFEWSPYFAFLYLFT